MSFAGKVAVIFGATGYVGQGATDAFLNAGATVVAVGRVQRKLDELKSKLKNTANLHLQTGDYTSEDTVKTLHGNINKLLSGKPIDHIVSSVGFVYYPPGAVTMSSLKDLHGALNEGLPENFLLAREFLPALKDREGTSYTLVSGGLAYACPEPHYWAATLKNASLNALTLGLASETQNDKVRLNNFCIGIPISAIGGEKNQFGLPGVSTITVGPIFTSIAAGSKKGEIINIKSGDEVVGLISGLAK